VVSKGQYPEDTNSITDTEKIVPVTSQIKGVSTSFKQKLAPSSVSIYQLQTGKK
jgi:alpha-N-arabinofuranosidase